MTIKPRNPKIRFIVIGFESHCPLVNNGTIGGVCSVRVFLRDPSPYLHEFQRKNTQKIWNWQSKILWSFAIRNFNDHGIKR